MWQSFRIMKFSMVRWLSAMFVALLLTVTNVQSVAEPILWKSDAAVQLKTGRVDVRAYVRERASRAGWTLREWKALSTIVWLESRWNVRADNPHSSAFGLFQILRMPPDTPLHKQVDAAIRYIKSRYGSPSVALEHHRKFGWY